MFEILLFVLFMFSILISAAKDKPRTSFNFFTFYKYLFVVIFFLILISSFINHNSVVLVVKSILGYYFPYIILFLLIVEADFSEKEQLNLLKFLLAIILFQIPFTAYQYIFLHYASADSNNGTVSYGIEGGTGIIAVLESFLISFAIAQILFKKINFKYITLAILTFIPPIVGGARFGFISLPLAIIITVASFSFLYKKVPIKKYINLLGIVSLFFILMIFIIVVVIPQTKYADYLNLNILTNQSEALQYDKGAGKYSRFQYYGMLLTDYFTNEADYAIGLGPGSITQSQSADTQTGLSFIIGRPDSLMVMASLGFIGLFLFLGVFLIALFFVKRYVEYEQNITFQIFACTLIPISSIVIISMFYCPTWGSQIGLFYWIILGLLVSRYKLYFTIKENFNYTVLKNKINLPIYNS